jgi:predicted MFS family arabinose efflux permease
VGFPWACRILGFIFLGLCVPANLFIRSRLPPKLGPDGRPKVQSVWPDFTIFRDRGFAMATVAIFFMEWGLFVPLTYIVSYAVAHDHSEPDSSKLLSILNAGSVVGRFLPGLLADKFGRFNIVILTNAMCAVSAFALWLPSAHSGAVLIVFCVFFGFVSGSNLGLYPVCLGQFCESQAYGRYFATASMMASFGTLTSLPIGGSLLGLGGARGWNALIAFSGSAYLGALACYISARVGVVGWNVKKKF